MILVGRKTRVGIVVSDKMNKTAVVMVERTIRHKKYVKTLKQRKKYKVHDANNVCKIGDKVRIEETRPISKDKCWRFIEIVGQAAK